MHMWKAFKGYIALFLVICGSTSIHAQSLEGPYRSENRISDDFILKKVSGRSNPELITDGAAVSILYSVLLLDQRSSGPNSKDLRDILGIEEAAVIELQKIAGTAILAEEREIKSGKRSICDSQLFQTNIANNTNPNSLLQKMYEFDSEIEIFRERFFRNEVIRVLGQVAYDYLMQWLEANIKPGMNEVKIDHFKRDIALGRNPFNRIVKFCQ